VDADIAIQLVNQSASLPGRLFEISLDGCRVHTGRTHTLTTPATVEVLFRINGIAFRLAGCLRWIDSQRNAGIEFAAMAQRRLDTLVELLDELEAEQAAKAAKEAAERVAAEQASAAEVPAGDERQLNNPNAAPAEAVAKAEKPPEAANQIPLMPSLPDRAQIAAPDLPVSQSVFALPKLSGRLPAGPLRPSTAPTQQLSKPSVHSESPQERKAEVKLAVVAKPQPVRPAHPAGRERRAQTRHTVDNRAVIFLIDVAARVPGRIIDLSMGGCRIRTDERFPVGIYRRVETEFKCDGLPFRLGGVVQSLHDKVTVGIRFLDMSARKREQLAQLMEEIEEMRKNPPLNPEPVETKPVGSE
jgi:hypothetical protein